MISEEHSSYFADGLPHETHIIKPQVAQAILEAMERTIKKEDGEDTTIDHGWACVRILIVPVFKNGEPIGLTVNIAKEGLDCFPLMEIIADGIADLAPKFIIEQKDTIGMLFSMLLAMSSKGDDLPRMSFGQEDTDDFPEVDEEEDDEDDGKWGGFTDD